MVRSAVHIDDVTLRLIERLDDPGAPLAETARRVAAALESDGRTRPGHETLRRHIKATRALRARLGPSTPELLLEGMLEGFTLGLGRELTKPRDARRRRRS